MAEQQSFDNRDGWIWFDGELKPWRETNVHVLTHALHYASSVFEGQRAYGGTIFKLHEHSERLVNSARLLGFDRTEHPLALQLGGSDARDLAACAVIALSLSLFNILILVSRTSNSFQAPLLAKRVEQQIAAGATAGLADFRWLLAFATAATVVGAVLIPTFQRLLSRWVESVGTNRAPMAMLRRVASPAVLAHVRDDRSPVVDHS